MPEIIAATAQEIAGQYTTSYDRAIALQDYFTSGDFAYSEDAPVEERLRRQRRRDHRASS